MRPYGSKVYGVPLFIDHISLGRGKVYFAYLKTLRLAKPFTTLTLCISEKRKVSKLLQQLLK